MTTWTAITCLPASLALFGSDPSSGTALLRDSALGGAGTGQSRARLSVHIGSADVRPGCRRALRLPVVIDDNGLLTSTIRLHRRIAPIGHPCAVGQGSRKNVWIAQDAEAHRQPVHRPPGGG